MLTRGRLTWQACQAAGLGAAGGCLVGKIFGETLLYHFRCYLANII
jgi:hypothetical protein